MAVTRKKANSVSQSNTSQSSQGDTSTITLEGLQDYVVDQVKTLNSKIFESDNKREENQIKLIEVLGIFMALLAFISINVQIFSRVKDTLSAGLFIFLFFCLISILMLIMDLILNLKKEEEKSPIYKNHRLLLIGAFIIIGIGSLIVLKDTSLNSVEGTLEFERSFENKLEEIVDSSLQDRFYSKEEVDLLLDKESNKHEDLKKCLKLGKWSECF